MRIGITGADGLVGKILVKAANDDGFIVVPISSRPKSAARFYKLGTAVPPDLFDGLDIFVHSGYDFNASSLYENERRNVRGSLDLLRAAEARGLKAFIFISSMSAFEGAESVYGRGKLAVEKETLKSPIGVVLRLGLVDSLEEKGILHQLRKLTNRFSLLPNIDGGRPTQYLLSEDFLKQFFAFLLSFIDRAIAVKAPILVAELGPLKFNELLTRLWKETHDSSKRPMFLPIPSPLLYWVLRFFEILRVPIGFRSDSLVGLVKCERKPNFKGFADLIKDQPQLNSKILINS